MADADPACFDPSVHRVEVERRWGEQARRRSDSWWLGLSDDGREGFLAEAASIGAQWAIAHEAGLPLDCEQVRGLAARHVEWIATGWGGVRPDRQQIVALAQMYVADERFAANYGGIDGAAYVRDALIDYVSG